VTGEEDTHIDIMVNYRKEISIWATAEKEEKEHTGFTLHCQQYYRARC
jgi:ABC-type metal ion transport system substrate-binding protein